MEWRAFHASLGVLIVNSRFSDERFGALVFWIFFGRGAVNPKLEGNSVELI